MIGASLFSELRRSRRAQRKRQEQRRSAAKDLFEVMESPVRSRDPIIPAASDCRSPSALSRRPRRRRVGRQRWGCKMPIVKVTDFAYARLQSPSLDDAERFLTDFGMVKAERTRDALYMRGTDAPHHIHVTHLGSSKFVGFAFSVASEDEVRLFAKAPGATGVEHLDEPGGGLVCGSRIQRVSDRSRPRYARTRTAARRGASHQHGYAQAEARGRSAARRAPRRR